MSIIYELTIPEPISYPFPLSDGTLAHLHLPARLSAEDAARLAEFVRSLAAVDLVEAEEADRP